MRTSLLLASCILVLWLSQTEACCPVGRSGKPIMNADQTVIILWDAAKKEQHFIRKASFASADQDFGFIIPSPSEPQLSESGNEAFATLQKLTEPEVIKRSRSSSISCGCGDPPKSVARPAAVNSSVVVLQEKQVAGFQTVVLDAKSSTGLVNWLKEHDYAYSNELAVWAQPYIEQGWKFTALKVAVKQKTEKNGKLVEADALRLSFKTDKPLFPYREPAYGDLGQKLNQKSRLLRIYFLAETSYQGAMGNQAWSGKVAWAGPVDGTSRGKITEQLKLPAGTGAAEWYLTEYEDNWPYTVAAGDVYFSADAKPYQVKRQPIIIYTHHQLPNDGSLYALAGVLIVPPLWRVWKKRQLSAIETTTTT